MATIGDNLHAIIFPQDGGGGNLDRIASELNDYRSENFADVKKLKKVDASTLDHWMRNQTHLKDYDIISLAKVLNCSCDEILLGVPPAERNILDSTGLSPEAVIGLRKDSYWVDTINFFFKNLEMLEVLKKVKEYLEIPINTRINTEYGSVDVSDIRFVQLEKVLRLGRSVKERINKKGEDPDGKTGKR